MMSYISINEVQAWCEPTKLTLANIDAVLEESVVSQVFARIAPTYDTSTWTGSISTPAPVLKILAMYYAAWYIDRTFSEDASVTNNYASLLRAEADNLLDGIIGGRVVISTILSGTQQSLRTSDPEFEFGDEGPYFNMGTVF